LGVGVNNIPELANKTVYGCLEYLIETSLSEQTGLAFYLDALGDQDDGLINDTAVVNPFPSNGFSLLKRDDVVEEFGTYGDFIGKLLALTNCRLRTEPSLIFKVIYPQDSDAVDETYYSSAAYTGDFMPVTFEGDEENETWDKTLVSNAQCTAKAESLGVQMKANALGTRVIIPMDARVELFDRVKTVDTRGA